MSTIATIKLFNEEDFIYYVMKAIEHCVDLFVLVEGCTKAMASNIVPPSKDGSSTDKTWEEVERFQKSSKVPVEIVKMGFIPNEISMWNKMISFAEVGDIVWMVDADEYYEPLDASSIMTFVKNTPYFSYRVPMVMYWHDFRHIITGGLWGDVIHERILRIPEEGCFYTYKSDLKRPDGEFVCGTVIEGRWNFRSDMATPIHHFSYARPMRKIVEKQVWQLVEYERWGQPDAKHGFGPVMAERWGRPADYITKSFCWFTNMFDDRLHDKDPEKFDLIKVKPWSNLIEGPIKQHPLYKYEWDGEDVFYVYPRA